MSDHLGKESILAELHNAYDVVGDADVRQKLESDIDEWERATRRSLRADDPYYEHRDIFGKSQDSLQQQEYSLPLIEKDLESFHRLAQKEQVDIQDSFWQKRIQTLRDSQQQKNVDSRTDDSRTGDSRTVDSRTANSGTVDSNADKNEALIETTKTETVGTQNKNKTIMTEAEEAKILRALLQERWGKMLDEGQAKWQLNSIAKTRRRLWDSLAEWLQYMQQLADALRDFAFEPGLLFDLAKDNLSLSDIAAMKKWVEYLRQDPEMRRLCDLLGRMRRAAYSKKQEWIESMEKFTEVKLDINSREEYSGVRLGNSIEHALPQEKALLADDETALLFDIKFAERRLMEFDTVGWAWHEATLAVQKQVTVTEDTKGPLIICVDTSGSMRGTPETIAKAVTLYLATAARQQKRDCFLINFSTGIETLDLSERGTFQNLIQFLQKSFSGGTDVAPALKHAMEMMQNENYKKADLLVVSDFVMDGLPQKLSPLIAAVKENNNRFFSLAIGDFDAQKSIKDVFDCEWHYKPGDGVRQLVDIVAETSDKYYQ